MMSNFSTMLKSELRAYVIAHPDDRAAFYVFVDRFTDEAPSETFDLSKSPTEIEDVEMLIRQRLEQPKVS
jgi:hypothetical protein